MAHSNSTTNYNLPQFISTDKPAWLTDVNTAYSDIDTGIHTAQVTADNAQSDATQALSTAGEASTSAAAADAKGSGAIASIATAFDTTSTYSVGDVVIYNNLLYVCSVDVITPGPWSGSANWSRTTLDSIVTNMKIQDLSNVSISTGDNGKILGISVSDNVIAVNSIPAKYTAGDVITLGGGIGCGQLGYNKIIFYIPLAKQIDTNAVNTCTLNLTLTVFGVRNDANVTVISSQSVSLDTAVITENGINLEVNNPNYQNYNSGLCWIKVEGTGTITLGHT